MNDKTDITVVLDRSGSMSSIKEATIGGFNTFINEQKKASGEAFISLSQFDDVYEVVYVQKSVKETPLLDDKTFVPRNGTALLDAIGRSINSTGDRLSNMSESDRPSKVIFVIITDGLENASVEFNKARIFEMITHQREKYSWQFIFLAANQDAIATACGLGISGTSAISYSSTSASTNAVFSNVSSNVLRFRNSKMGSNAVADFSPEEYTVQAAANK
jgi:hypothetical protein